LPCKKEPQRLEVSPEPWGRGWVIEDVWVDKKEKYEDWEPHLQAIKNERGDLAIRFCYWMRKPDGERGDFVNRSMFVYDFTIDDLREEAKKTKAEVILMLLKRLAE